MKKFKEYITKENLVIIIIILLSVLVSTIFIFDKGLYDGVDTKYHMSRIIGIVNSWKAGNIPAYIHLDDTGYGYAMGFFYSNLFMIFPCIIYMISNDIFLAYKLLLILCSLFTAISMYVCVKRITRSKYSATISTILYTTCGYRIITMVAKAFAGELLSFIFIPIIILGLYELIFNDEKKWWIFALGFIGILNSNLVMTEIMIAISAIIVLCNIKTILKNRTRLTGFIKATIFTLLICSAFWMPLIEQLCKSSFVMTEKMSIYKPTRWLLDFCDMFWGTIQYENNLAAAYGLGIIFIVILLFRLKIKENDKILKFCDISILTGLILLLCMTYFFPWKYLESIGEMIQFPSRMEVPVAAFFSIACGIICNYVTKNKIIKRKIVIINIIIWQVVFSVICLKSCINVLIEFHGVNNKEEIKVTNEFEYNICDGVYLPSKGNYIFAQIEYRTSLAYKNEGYIKNEEDLIEDIGNVFYEYKKENLKIDVNYENNIGQNTYIELPMYYYYGYVAESINDGSTYKIEQGDNGLIRIYLNKEKDSIKVYYKLTNIQKISIIISIITLIWLIYFIIKRLKNKGGIKLKRNKGITLIALVVTIVVLLILAGISISMLGGENGIITKAQEAKEENRGGTVEERRDLWKANQKSDESTNSNTAQTLDELLADLENEGLLTSEEVAIIKDVGVITIGSHVIDFTDGEIDWSKMAPGLYETGTTNMIKSWEELQNEGSIIIEDSTLRGVLVNDLEGDLIISKEISIIGEDFFGLVGSQYSCGGYDCRITNVYIPSSVKKISSFAFYRFSNIKSIYIPNSVTNIGENAFYGCSSLISIEIPDNVTSIKSSTFRDCSSLISIGIPDNVTSIEDFAFYGCSSLTSIEIPSSIISIGNHAFYECSSIKNICIPNTVVTIEDYTFYGCSSLENIEILDSVTSIGSSAFSGCESLTSIEIPNNVTIIGSSAFSGCESLTSIEISDSVTSIGNSAFYHCTGLTNIIIPKSITSIETLTFFECSNLKTVNYTGTKTEWNTLLSSISYGNDNLMNAKIICTDGEIN